MHGGKGILSRASIIDAGNGIDNFFLFQGFLCELRSNLAPLTFLYDSLAVVVCICRFWWNACRNFISTPVVSGFTQAAVIVIILSQIKNMMGVSFGSAKDNVVQTLAGYWRKLPDTK